MPDRPARSQSLYRLSYPAHIVGLYLVIIVTVAHLTPPDKQLLPDSPTVDTPNYENMTQKKEISNNVDNLTARQCYVDKCYNVRNAEASRGAEMVTYSLRLSRRSSLARQSNIAYQGSAPDTVQGMKEQH